MKIYISSDIEGVTGVSHGEEAGAPFREQMSKEVAAACEGALAAGAEEIYVKDAHGGGRNIIPTMLPGEVKLIKGWAPHPTDMVQGIDGSFDALMFIGYHSAASTGGNPLAHTLNGRITWLRFNGGPPVSELVLSAYAGALYGVPTVFVSGDEGLCEQAHTLNGNIETVAVSQGVGGSSISIHPELAVERIREGAASAVKKDLSALKIALPEHFSVELRLRDHQDAYKASHFPGVSLVAPHRITLETDDYYEVLRMMLFIV